jgi:hypothetical protein
MPKAVLPFIGLLLFLQTQSQSFFGTLFTGGANYQGEIQEVSFAFRGMRYATGLGAQFRLRNHLWVSTEVMLGHLSGKDSDIHNNTSNIARNLSFETDIQELSLQLRLNILPGLKQPFVPYVTGGAAVFRIDPYAFDASGQKHFLYPLSTEGQGLAAYPDRMVPKKINFSVPMGAGLEFKSGPRLRFDVEVLYRKSFTDYIDDVSTNYPDEALLIAAKGPKAVEMSYRSDELVGGSSVFPSGSQRGNGSRKDWYHIFNFRLKYSLFEDRGSDSKNRKRSSTDCWKDGGRRNL